LSLFNPHLQVGFRIDGIHTVGQVGHVGSQVDQEGFSLLFPDKTNGLTEENIGAVSLILLGLPVVVVGIVIIIIAPVVGNLSDSSTQQSHHLFKALVLRPEGPGITQVPFPKLTRTISIFPENLSNGHLLSLHIAPSPAGAPGACTDGIPSGHQARSGWSAQHILVKVGQVHRFSAQLVNLGRFQPGIPQASQVIPLVVRHYDDHIRRLFSCWLIFA